MTRLSRGLCHANLKKNYIIGELLVTTKRDFFLNTDSGLWRRLGVSRVCGWPDWDIWCICRGVYRLRHTNWEIINK